MSPALLLAAAIAWSGAIHADRPDVGSTDTHRSRPAAATSSSRAAGRRPLPSAPTTARELTAPDTATTRIVVNGIPVIIRRVSANDVVTANVYLLGGLRQVTNDNAGIESFLLDVSERGTRHFTRDRLRQTMARLGTTIVVDPAVDWTTLGVRATSATFDSTWAVMTDRLMYPTLDSASVELIREQYRSAVRQRGDSPDALVEYLADSATYAGTAYGRPLAGTERSIASITRAQLRAYEQTQVVRSRLLVVVVGNVVPARVEQLVRRTLGQLPAGAYHWTIPQASPLAQSVLVARQRELPTNYILGYYQGPPASGADYQALRVAAAALSGQLFEEIRSKRNLSYAVNAPFVDRALSAGGFYVTTVAPDSVLEIMHHELGVMQSNLVDPGALDRLVQQFITEYFLDNETNADQANLLVRAELYRGDYREADRFVDELRKVTPRDIQRVARTYMKHVAFAYVGDTARVSRAVVEEF
jgi:zinc protease